MILTLPGRSETATLENAPPGLTLTAQLRDGDETLPDALVVTPKLDAEGDPLNAYQAPFTSPADLPVEVVWLQGATIVAREVVARATSDDPVSTDEPYFTIEEARAFSLELANDEKYPDEEIAATRALVEGELEKRCGQSFTTRTTTETLDANGASDMLLRWPRPLSVLSASLDGTALAPADLVLYPEGRIYHAGYWTRGRGNLTITYTHGHATVLLAAKRAALTWAKHLLIKGPIDDRTTTFQTDDGNFTLATPGVRGSHTGIPVVDEFIDTYNLNVCVA